MGIEPIEELVELFPESSAAAQLLQDSGSPYWATFASFCNLPAG